MEKEKVLEIEITKINNDWSAITVKKIKEDFENNDFFEWLTVGGNYLYDRKIFINRICPHIPFLIRNENIEHLEDIVNTVNQKYGIPYRWRARPHEKFFCIYANGEISTTQDDYGSYKESFYELGNYFKSEAEAQKVVDSKEWKDFWEKVRNGEIGG